MLVNFFLVKRTIDDGRLKEKEYIKTLAQLEQRSHTAKERITLLRERINTSLAEKEKTKSLMKMFEDDMEGKRFYCSQI